MKTKLSKIATAGAVALCSWAALAALPVAAASLTAASVKERVILLADDHAILYRSGTRRELRPAMNYAGNPLIRPADAEKNQIGYCSVYRDEKTGRFQLWYQESGNDCVVCYAESTDGFNWTKPDLGLLQKDGIEEKNIVFMSTNHYGASVVVNPADSNPARKYKMAFWSMPKKYDPPYPGLYVAFSPDGIHWTQHPEGPLLRGAYGKTTDPGLAGDATFKWGVPMSVSDVVDAAWDPVRQLYMIYAKSWLDDPTGQTYWKRAVVRTESADFIHWTKPVLVMVPDEFDGAHPEKFGGQSQGVQLHSGPVFFHEGIYFSLVQTADFGGNGLQPSELALSRDGLTWTRPFRQTPFLRLGAANEFNASRIWSNATPITVGDEMRFYYGGYQNPWGHDKAPHFSGVGVAIMQRDRFAGLRPITEVGQVTLKPVKVARGGRLELNADASHGVVRVELLNEDAYRVPGFTKADAVPLTGDNLRHAVAWKNQTGELPEGTYIIRLHLEKAEVFALTLR